MHFAFVRLVRVCLNVDVPESEVEKFVRDLLANRSFVLNACWEFESRGFEALASLLAPDLYSTTAANLAT